MYGPCSSKKPPENQAVKIIEPERACLLGFLLAGLVGDAAGGFAGGLAGSLALSAPAVLKACVQIPCRQCLDLHLIHLILRIPDILSAPAVHVKICHRDSLMV